MFNWTTTTIINKLQDLTTGADLVKVWTGAEDGEDGLKAGFSGQYPVIKIKRDHTFEARYISKVYKAIANNPTLCEMTIDCDKILGLIDDEDKPAHVRLSFYVALEGSEESIYANDGYQKGKPFSVGFDVTSKDTKLTIAKKIKKNAEKYGVVTYGKKVFEIVNNEDGTITLKGTHEYQRFYNAVVALDDLIDELILDSYTDGELKDDGTPKKVSDEEVFKLENRGINGFGTYSQLLKDLRLPTAHHNKWLQLKEDEKLEVGAKYNQFIITYCAPSMANPGFTVVGQHNMSVTTHVFWVNQNVSDDFESLLVDEAGISVEAVNSVETDANNVDTVTYEEAGVKTTGGEKYSANHEQTIVDTAEEETAQP